MSSNETCRVAVEPPVRKVLKCLSKDDHLRVIDAIQSLITDPYTGDLQKLGGTEDSWRRRVGSYRIFFEISQSERRVDIFKIERRGSKTY
ncbi:type II toxin-antitoxin system RelE/ParE family toxin [bacterium]|nr:MAG: type II toxin-antitoxin system RelE/ParE family toxin [bacterium]